MMDGVPFFSRICTYLSMVMLTLAWRMSSFVVATSAPPAFTRVPNEWRRVCQPTRLVIPARSAAGRSAERSFRAQKSRFELPRL